LIFMAGQINKYLGIDWGEKRIGVAIADSEMKLAVPWGTVSDLEELLGVVETENAHKLVVGMPISLNGEKGGFSDGFNKFVADLEKRSGMPVEYVDERLTSQEADSRAAGGKIDRDAVAAMLILQTFLDTK